MLRTLLESRSHPHRNRAAALVSAFLHGGLILAAAYATASGSPPDDVPDPGTKIHWIPNAPQRAPSTPSMSHAPRPSRPSFTPPSVQIDIDAPTVRIDFDAPISPRTDFEPGLARQPEPSVNREADRSAGQPYDAAEVDVAVTVMSNGATPEYPASLRAAGVEGQVVAQFVVDESGRAQASTIVIRSATNELFAESVRRAIPRMRFTPARANSRKVAQMVQQLFVFRLDR